MSDRIKVLMIGPFSYVGGINVHMTRLCSLLSCDVDFDFADDAPKSLSVKSYLNIRRLASFPRFLKKINSADIVHIHSGNWMLRVSLIVLSWIFSAKVVVTLHSYRIDGFRKKVSDTLIKRSSAVVCVNSGIKAALGTERAYVKEAFIPPVFGSGRELPQEIMQFIHSHREWVLASANAYRLTRYEGRDLYGLDQCLEVARMSKRRGDKVAIIFVVATVMDTDDLYFKAKSIIVDEGLDEYIMVYPFSLNFIELMRQSDVVIRPTITDGDAITIREALFLGKPVIASDIVERPEGTLYYRAGDVDQLFSLIQQASESETCTQNVDKCNVGISSSLEIYRIFYTKLYEVAVV